MSSGRIIALVAACAAVTAIAVIGIVHGSTEVHKTESKTDRPSARPTSRNALRPHKPLRKAVDAAATPGSSEGADEKIRDAIDELALKDEGKSLLAEAERYLKNDSAEVREHYLDMLGSTDAGKSLDAVAVYQVALTDVNEDVRQQAGMRIADAIAEVSSDGTRITYAESSFVRVKDETAATAIAQLYSQVGNEQLALASITKLLEEAQLSEAAAQALKEAYEIIKGTPYEDVEEPAEKAAAPSPEGAEVAPEPEAAPDPGDQLADAKWVLDVTK